MQEKYVSIAFGDLELVVMCPSGPDHPCQDAVSAYQGFAHGKPYIVAAVADGHGSPIYKNSAVGAKLAADSATLCLSDAARLLIEADIKGSPFSFSRYLEDDLPAQILRNWRAQVEGEILRTDHDAPEGLQDDNDRSFNIQSFGSTLIATLVVEERVAVITVGDSRCFMVAGDDACTKEICPDNRVRASSETDSLCGGQAKYQFRSEAVELSGSHDVMLYLCSDGTSDAMDDEEFQKAIVSIYRGFQNNDAGWIGRNLGEKLREWSDDGSRDDMGTAVLFRRAEKRE